VRFAARVTLVLRLRNVELQLKAALADQPLARHFLAAHPCSLTLLDSAVGQLALQPKRRGRHPAKRPIVGLNDD